MHKEQNVWHCSACESQNSVKNTVEASHKYIYIYMVEYEGESYVDGPLLMHCILMETKTPSHSAIQAVKDKIRNLHVRNFKFNLPKAINQMNKLLKDLDKLQGSMSETDKLDSVYRFASQLHPDENCELYQYVSILHHEDDKARTEQRAYRLSADLIQELKDDWSRLNPPNATKQSKKKSDNVDKKTLVNLITTLLSSSSTDADDKRNLISQNGKVTQNGKQRTQRITRQRWKARERDGTGVRSAIVRRLSGLPTSLKIIRKTSSRATIIKNQIPKEILAPRLQLDSKLIAKR